MALPSASLSSEGVGFRGLRAEEKRKTEPNKANGREERKVMVEGTVLELETG